MSRWRTALLIPFLALPAVPALGTSSATSTAPTGFIEEVIVTAQRVEQNAQDVPLAVTALLESDIRDRQIIGLTDVQLFVPNVIYSDENYGSPIVTIRGVGRLSATAELSPVSIHINDVPQRFAPMTELYDLERIEVLRGPQGTLYGRNSTAGSVNLISKRPRLEGNEGFLEVETGNYSLRRIRAAGEVTITDNFGVRFAGVKLTRDGYIENLAAGSVSGVDDDMDGRDVYSFRVTPRWDLGERTSVWAMYEHTKENDDRVRISNHVCKAPEFPLLG